MKTLDIIPIVLVFMIGIVCMSSIHIVDIRDTQTFNIGE